MKILMRIPRMVSERIKTTKDLNDFFAYNERYGDEITYDWEEDELPRIEELMDDMNYVAGCYDRENALRIERGGR